MLVTINVLIDESKDVNFVYHFILTLVIPAKARDYVFTGVGLSVYLSVCLFVCLFVTTITK